MITDIEIIVQTHTALVILLYSLAPLETSMPFNLIFIEWHPDGRHGTSQMISQH